MTEVTAVPVVEEDVKVRIGGVLFTRHADGRLTLVDTSIPVQKVSDKIISYTHFPKHNQHYNDTYVMGEWVWNGCQKFHVSDKEQIFSNFDVPKSFQNDINDALAMHNPEAFELDQALLHDDEEYRKMASLCGLILGDYTEYYINHLGSFDKINAFLATMPGYPETLYKYVEQDLLAENIETLKAIDGFTINKRILIRAEKDADKRALMMLESRYDLEGFLTRNTLKQETLKTLLAAFIENHKNLHNIGQDKSGYQTLIQKLIKVGYPFSNEERREISTHQIFHNACLYQALIGCDVTSFDFGINDNWVTLMQIILSPNVTPSTLQVLHDYIAGYGDRWEYACEVMRQLHPSIEIK